MGFGGNLVQGFRVYAWRAVPSLLQIALWVPSLALWPQPLKPEWKWKPKEVARMRREIELKRCCQNEKRDGALHIQSWNADVELWPGSGNGRRFELWKRRWSGHMQIHAKKATHPNWKKPSEMVVAPRYKLLVHCLHRLHCWHCLNCLYITGNVTLGKFLH